MALINPTPYYYTLYNKKSIGADFFTVLIFEGEWQHQFIEQKCFDKSGKYLLNELLSNKGSMKSRLEQSRALGKELTSFCKENLLKNLSKLKNKDLIQLLYKYFDLYAKFSVVNVPPWMILSETITKNLQDKLSKSSVPDIQKTISIMSTPKKKSYVQEEDLACINLAIQIKKYQIKDFTNNKDFRKIIRKNFWIPFDYLGPKITTTKDLKLRIDHLISFQLSELISRREKIIGYKNETAFKQKSLIKEQRLNKDIVFLFISLQDIATLQDEKKAITTESHFYLQQLYKEIAKRVGIPFLDIYFLQKEEIKDMLTEQSDFSSVIKQRKKASATIIFNGRIKILIGKELSAYLAKNNLFLPSKEKISKDNVINGIVGSQGLVQGNVRIIENIKQAHLFNKGEILVTTMTTPNYMPIMKKAKAIITDEGGLTCHAVIVSRELGIPCIIGTKNATKMLKDGDYVEVDANKGIIKKLK